VGTAHRYVARRIIFALITIAVAISINFLLFRLAPGDPVTRLARVPGMTPEAQAALRVQFGLDEPIGQQFVAYLTQLVQGNLGISYQNQRPVIDNLRSAYLATIPMVGLGAVAAIIFGLALAVVGALRRKSPADHATSGLAILFYSLPTQWLGMMLVLLFGAYLPTRGAADPFLLDTSPLSQAADSFKHMILPSLTLGLVLFGQYTIVARAAVDETLGEDYILAARARGMSNGAIVRRYSMRNALLPITTLIALSLGFVVAGSILVETVYSWPGIGNAIYEAVIARDYPTLQGAFLVLTVSVVVANLIADLLYLRLDPRVAQ